MKPVIICGGWGTKMWPISREHHPKHFIKLIGDKSLFQLNYEALRTRFNPEEIYVSTNVDQLPLAREQAPDIPSENFILEPEMKNTGPAISLIAATLYKKGFADEPFMVIQADVLREPTESFIKMMDDCDSLARRETKYITGGFKPDFPIMGVDYLVKGDRVSAENEVGTYKVDKFVWRSTKEETEELLKQDNALVHTNHTCMTPRNMISMIQKYRPDWNEPLQNIINGADVFTEFKKLPSEPQENMTQDVHAAGESLIVEIPFKWVDFGTFESVYKYLKDKNIYHSPENLVENKSNDNFVLLDDPDKVVCIVGQSNLVVVDTGDALLICNRLDSSLVGDVLKEVKKREISLT